MGFLFLIFKKIKVMHPCLCSCRSGWDVVCCGFMAWCVMGVVWCHGCGVMECGCEIMWCGGLIGCGVMW